MASRILSSVPRVCGLSELTQTLRFLQGSLESLFRKSRTSFDVPPISELGLQVNEDFFLKISLERRIHYYIYHFINKCNIFSDMIVHMYSYLWFFPLFWRIFIFEIGYNSLTSQLGDCDIGNFMTSRHNALNDNDLNRRRSG